MYCSQELLNSSQMAPVAENLHGIVGNRKSEIESESRGLTKQGKKGRAGVQEYRQIGMLLHIYGGDPHLLSLCSHMQGGPSFTCIMMYNFSS